MKKIKYIVSLVLFCLLLILDILFALATVAVAIDKKEPSAVVVGIVFSAFFIFLTVKCRSYSKKLDNAKDDDSKIEKVDVPKSSSKAVDVIAVDSVSKRGNLKPNYEIKYRDAEGNESVRKIFVRKFDGRVIEAHCFLRGDERTFYVPRIVECVDLETSEVINADEFYGDLRWYFNKKFNNRYKPSDMFNPEEWNGFSFSSFSPLLDEMDRFEINEVFVMKIADY